MTTKTIESAEIKNFKECAGNEGSAFSCSLYIDGKRVAEVRNDGNGGGNFYDFDPKHRDLEDPFIDYLNTMPSVVEHLEENPPEDDEPKWMRRVNADIGFEDLLEEFELKKLERKVVLFRVPGQKYREGEWSTVHHRGQKEPAREAMRKKYGNGVVFATTGE